MLSAVYFDYRVQHVLGITDFEKQRLRINTVSNFRSRLCAHEAKTGEDLLQQEVDALTEELIKVSEMDTFLARQDSMMVSANCKK